jgi:hypothetical protein
MENLLDKLHSVATAANKLEEKAGWYQDSIKELRNALSRVHDLDEDVEIHLGLDRSDIGISSLKFDKTVLTMVVAKNLENYEIAYSQHEVKIRQFLKRFTEKTNKE